MERIQRNILVGVPSVCRHVDEEYYFVPIGGEINRVLGQDIFDLVVEYAAIN